MDHSPLNGRLLSFLLLFCFASSAELRQAVPAALSAAGKQMLSAQNAVRATVGVPPLEWSAALAAEAQEWAAHLAAEGRLLHHLNPQHGENLLLSVRAEMGPRQAVQRWAAERNNYNARDNTCRGSCGHYTQMVWRDTQRVGCGAAKKGDVQVWVCEYDPPGNIVGERPY